MNTPDIPAGVIKWLNDTFPERSRQQGESDHDSTFYGGKRSVVRFINAAFAEQNTITRNTADVRRTPGTQPSEDNSPSRQPRRGGLGTGHRNNQRGR